MKHAAVHHQRGLYLRPRTISTLNHTDANGIMSGLFLASSTPGIADIKQADDHKRVCDQSFFPHRREVEDRCSRRERKKLGE